jgi:hypothetical protein
LRFGKAAVFSLWTSLAYDVKLIPRTIAHSVIFSADLI